MVTLCNDFLFKWFLNFIINNFLLGLEAVMGSQLKGISPSNSIGGPDTVAKISRSEVRDLHIGKQDFVLPAWKSSICCFKNA